MPSIRLADIPNAGPQSLGASNVGISAPSVPRFAVDPQAAKLTGAAMVDSSMVTRGARSMLDQTLELNAYSQEAQAAAQFGQSIGKIGEVALAYSEKMAKAKDTADLARAETLMRSAFEKQQNDQMNTPVDKWQEKWTANIEQTKKAIGEIGISNNAAQSLSPAFERWGEMSGIQIEGEANKKRIEGYQQDIEANALMKIADDDIEGAIGIYNKAVADEILSEPAGKLAVARLQDNYVRQAKEQQRETIAAEILTDPRRAKEILTKAKTGEVTEFGELEPSRIKLHLYEADRQIRVADSDNWNSLVERIQNKDITSAEQLDKEAEGMGIEPSKYKRLKNAIAANITFDPKVAGDLKAKVAGFDYGADKDDAKFSALSAEIVSRLPKEQAQLLGDQLTSGWKKAFDGVPKSPREVYRSDFIQGIKRIGDSGLLGETGLDQDGKTIVDQSKNNTYNAKVYSVMEGMDEWFNNPANKDKTPADAQQHRDSLIEPLLKGKALELFKQKAKPSFIPGTGFQTRKMDRMDSTDFVKPTPTPPPAQEAIDKSEATKAQGKVTSYNFPGDAYSDTNSRNLLGAWNNKLTKNSLAISPDIERQFKAAGIGKGDPVELTLADGSTVIRNWDDRTMQDADAIKKFGKPLTGRFDFHSPGGKQKNDGMAVVSFRKATNA
jgi:hypothetical protein